jgi:hypothetical protein
VNWDLWSIPTIASGRCVARHGPYISLFFLIFYVGGVYELKAEAWRIRNRKAEADLNTTLTNL